MARFPVGIRSKHKARTPSPPSPLFLLLPFLPFFFPSFPSSFPHCFCFYVQNFQGLVNEPKARFPVGIRSKHKARTTSHRAWPDLSEKRKSASPSRNENPETSKKITKEELLGFSPKLNPN
jgi:hypothetical protein